jgi:hypothetical protein
MDIDEDIQLTPSGDVSDVSVSVKRAAVVTIKGDAQPVKKARTAIDDAVRTVTVARQDKSFESRMQQEYAKMVDTTSQQISDAPIDQPFYFAVLSELQSETGEKLADGRVVGSTFAPASLLPWTVLWNRIVHQLKGDITSEITVKNIPSTVIPEQDAFLAGMLYVIWEIVSTENLKLKVARTDAFRQGQEAGKAMLADHVDQHNWERGVRKFPISIWTEGNNRLGQILQEVVRSHLTTVNAEKTATAVLSRIHNLFDIISRCDGIKMKHILPTEHELNEKILMPYSVKTKKVKKEKGKKMPTLFSFPKEEADIHKDIRSSTLDFLKTKLNECKDVPVKNVPTDYMKTLHTAVVQWNSVRAALLKLQDKRIKSRPKTKAKREKKEIEAFNKKPFVQQIAQMAKDSSSDNIIAANALQGAIAEKVFQALRYDAVPDPKGIGAPVEEQVAQLKAQRNINTILSAANKLARLLATRGVEANNLKATL